ncbi:MAG: hypothetical protein LBL21_02320 [Rickettsiales bacterium]|jgi:hypothetical protein|nr:hypothetical protein [Rickettsiales bacterium]
MSGGKVAPYQIGHFVLLSDDYFYLRMLEQHSGVPHISYLGNPIPKIGIACGHGGFPATNNGDAEKYI